MTAVPAIRFMTVEEYLEMEDASQEKHEYYGGEVFAMAGAGFTHNQVVANTFGNTYQYLKDKDCRIYGSDLKVNVKTKSAFVYPDLTIICNDPQFLEDRKDIVTNPVVIIEIFSPGTQNFDHGEKFMLYRQIPALQEYILISSMELLVEKFLRHPSGSWTLTEYKKPEDKFSIDNINYQISLAEIYRDVVFEQGASELGRVRERE